MDVKAYIESGILEEYILGTVSEQEFREVRCLSSIYPEIQQEIEAIEARLIQYSEASAPSRELDLEELMKKVEGAETETRTETVTVTETVTEAETEVHAVGDGVKEEKSGEQKTKVIDITTRWWQAAAVIIFLINLLLLWRGMQANRDREELISKVENLGNVIVELESNSAEQQNLSGLIRDENVRKIALKSTDSTIGRFAGIYWNTKEHSVYLDPGTLPTPPDGKQYQLWILKDGKPIDMGVLPVDASGIVQMKDAESADAFAITLEDFGGKPQPNLEELKVMGRV
ncbi:MAG: hypothetical protein GC181_11960 [Bacteroidetes bacterium]|nr:hypothetical protein [Bacteroidota bacterium]